MNTLWHDATTKHRQSPVTSDRSRLEPLLKWPDSGRVKSNHERKTSLVRMSWHIETRERTEHQASAVTIDRTRLVIGFRLWTSLNVTGPCKGRVRFFYRWVRSQLNEHMFGRWLLGSRGRGWMQVTRGYILVTGPWYRRVRSVWKVPIKGVQWLYLPGGYKTKY
jgi:hypothetical protein